MDYSLPGPSVHGIIQEGIVEWIAIHDRSLSKLLNPYDRIHALIKRYNSEQMAAGMRLV